MTDLAAETGTIATFTGELFTPLRPDVARIRIEDIAHALANSCRFTGHVREFYSVAQHSFLCSTIVSEENALTALLHDASEAYLSDLARPIKYQPGLGDAYKECEARLEEAIAEKFGLPYPWPDEVKWADRVLLVSEQRDLMPNVLRADGADYLDFEIAPLIPRKAEHVFLERFRELA